MLELNNFNLKIKMLELNSFNQITISIINKDHKQIEL